MLTQWNPFRALERDLNWLAAGRPDAADASANHPFKPAVDVVETEAAFVLTVDLPGLTRDAVSINLENNVLTLEGTREAPQPVEGAVLRRERRHGSFRRSFRLGEQIDQSGISATFANGVLNVSLPKAEASRPRKISVN